MGAIIIDWVSDLFPLGQTFKISAISHSEDICLGLGIILFSGKKSNKKKVMAVAALRLLCCSMLNIYRENRTTI